MARISARCSWVLVPLRDALGSPCEDMQRKRSGDLEALLADEFDCAISRHGLANAAAPAGPLERRDSSKRSRRSPERFLSPERHRRCHASPPSATLAPQPAEPIAIALYRAVREALTSVGERGRRHGSSSEIGSPDGERLRLTVGDDGPRYHCQETRRAGSLGLLRIRERLRVELGGAYSVARGRKAAVRVFLPSMFP